MIKNFDSLTDGELAAKIDRAEKAFSAHRFTSFAERSRKIMKVAQILEEQKNALARIMTLEMGKPIRAAVDEVVKCAWVCRFYAENAEKFLADEAVESSATKSYVRYRPLGIVLAIMPWNYPLWQVMR